MLDHIVTVIVSILGVHALLKFAFFFVVPYKQRRAALDRAYGENPTATRTSDSVFLAIAVLIAALMVWRGIEATSFLGGIWIGATLIQLYFHRYHEPLNPGKAPPPVVSPIKTVSYAIQEAPQRAWRELLVMTVLIILALALIIERHV